MEEEARGTRSSSDDQNATEGEAHKAKLRAALTSDIGFTTCGQTSCGASEARARCEAAGSACPHPPTTAQRWSITHALCICAAVEPRPLHWRTAGAQPAGDG